jgi:hypothetical protein
VGTSDDYEFPFLSIEAEEFVNLGTDVRRSKEALYKEEDDSCRPAGDRVGWVFIREEKATPDGELVALYATVRTDDGDKVDISVVVGKGTDGRYGKGKGGMSGGTGKWKGRTDVVDFEQCNPKRWRVEGGGP